MWLFLLFLSIPLIEIALFIQVGGLIGLWPTLGIVLATAVAGTWLMRQQGALALSQVRNSFNELRDPTEPLAHGAMILFAGAMLLTPGFFTDTMGLLLLIPTVRSAAYRWLSKRVVVQSVGFGAPPRGGPAHARPRPAREDIIDGDFEDLSSQGAPEDRGSLPPSGWTRH
ncbi:exlusion protein FxsA [Rhodovulum sulfidophilum]|uniref:FxsA family protein n=1 Tax=Rhodovulum visakhapatnamense TaxID=364297 RepID=A0ABS1RAE0_9RHOB|nr:FxsA family protein [Rhodovulum visakhapatnamense]MBL3568256.1 FxsA family protein [Rhodovulum visakhapatnamense]MBL3576606.1 FxsA family protein [Rhodovulum visakhapatnamense]OLS43206.1 exlusion protein FxsA [Rhodovulum sulfidophilum]